MKKLIKTMCKENLIVSMSEGRRLILGGAVKVDGERVDDIDADISPGQHKIAIGKKVEKTLTSE